ncbi:estradiol 17-beta-dehydrogenase 8-like [Gigantopelta aegis]|uniref:estradiol 17-beta-dehydrogenase 8-like n=1 Tax=Gigantopelta aegis TaxID=1735272 RepID=UPI001B88E54A|nr:estradiol 17-beta-dehydrogenase 8-like [Gigantopelta aegis]
MATGGLLAGRLALVSGAGSGIGRAICQAFAKEGAILAAVDVNKNNAESTLSMLQDGPHAAFSVDISSSSEVNAMMAQIKSHFSQPLIVAVSAAGITRDHFLLKMEEKHFDRIMDINLKGTFLLNQAVGRAIRDAETKDGSIINISSISALRGNIGQANYCASKAGVIGLTKTAAKELAKFNIRVNAVLPGFIETPMTDVVPERVRDIVSLLIPLGRFGRPEEVADTCVFLASDKSRYVTGACLEVTGGLYM